MTSLNELSPTPGSRHSRKRVGRGIGSGVGKTCGKGHKGQKARSGGFHKINFEGGQMPIQRRLPKLGFKSRCSSKSDQVTLYEISNTDLDLIDLNSLKSIGLVSKRAQKVKIIDSGELTKSVKIKGLQVTAGAMKKLQENGSSVEE